MSDKKKFPFNDAYAVAKEIHYRLKDFCEPGFCKAVGSLRRYKPLVSDVEFLFVPHIRNLPDGLFDTEPVDQANALFYRWLNAGYLQKRPNVNGSFTWGPLNKLAIHVASGIPVDLFTTTKDNWWVSLVIRTGSKETNLKLTTGAQAQGATLNAYGSGVTWSDGTSTPALSEAHVFEMCQVPYKEPRDR